jgi:hyaluronoglucosaminidase
VIEARAKIHGVVEGFYGKPWSHGARLSLVRFLGAVKLDTYVWAPKGDPAHRARWWEPLGPERLREIEVLVSAGRDAGVEVVHGISPVGLAPLARRRRARGELDRRGLEALRRRIRDVASAGVTRFALLFDDTLPTFWTSLASREIGRAHGTAAREIEQAGAASEPAAVLLVPSVYHRRATELSAGARRYLEGVVSVVGRDVPLAWTGPSVFSPWISGADLRAIEAAAGARVFVWNNAVTNDLLPLATGEVLGRPAVERLSAGPVTNMSVEATRSAAGVLINGTREAEVTKVAAFTLAELVRDPEGYAPWHAWRRAVDAVFGPSAAATRQLLDLVRGHPQTSPWVREAGRLHDLLAAAGSAQRLDDPSLLAELDRIAGLEAGVRRELEGHPALAELRPTAAEAARIAGLLARVLRGQVRPREIDRVLGARPRWATGLDDVLALVRRRRFR